MAKKARKKPFRLEVGKRCVSRDGFISPPVEKNGGKTYPFSAGGSEFTISGYFFGHDCKDNRDLIEEYTGPVELPVTEKTAKKRSSK